eukprot:1157640-Pelagomonas_calceolata.AAC.1
MLHANLTRLALEEVYHVMLRMATTQAMARKHTLFLIHIKHAQPFAEVLLSSANMTTTATDDG